MVETIRMEIAHCSEKAYASLPISNAKNLLFLDSDRSVTEFAKKVCFSVIDPKRPILMIIMNSETGEYEMVESTFQSRRILQIAHLFQATASSKTRSVMPTSWRQLFNQIASRILGSHFTYRQDTNTTPTFSSLI